MRPEQAKIVRCLPLVRAFGPADGPPDGPGSPPVELTVAEFEALRLADLLARDQVAGAASMGTSRATFGRLLERAREKVARALVQGRPLHITGDAPAPPPGADTMRLAIAITRHQRIARHFGQSQAFRVVDVGPDGARTLEERPNPHRGQRGPHAQGRKSGTLGSEGRCGGHQRGACAHVEHPPGHGHEATCCHGGHGHAESCSGRRARKAEADAPEACAPGAGEHGWLDVVADCEAAVALGLGAGAREGLRKRGVRPIVLDRELTIEQTIALFRAGRL